jgi:hypothetical protein
MTATGGPPGIGPGGSAPGLFSRADATGLEPRRATRPGKVRYHKDLGDIPSPGRHLGGWYQENFFQRTMPVSRLLSRAMILRDEEPRPFPWRSGADDDDARNCGTSIRGP